jgi:hypothetical protein
MVTKLKYIKLNNCGLRNSVTQFFKSPKPYKNSFFLFTKCLVYVACTLVIPMHSIKDDTLKWAGNTKMVKVESYLISVRANRSQETKIKVVLLC